MTYLTYKNQECIIVGETEHYYLVYFAGDIEQKYFSVHKSYLE